MELKRKFIEDVAMIGFDKKDIELILRKKGLYALEKSLIVEQLSAMATIPELVDEKKRMEAEEARLKAIEDEKEKEKQRQINWFGDIRDNFLYKVPLLAPNDFKPLNKHK